MGEIFRIGIVLLGEPANGRGQHMDGMEKAAHENESQYTCHGEESLAEGAQQLRSGNEGENQGRYRHDGKGNCERNDGLPPPIHLKHLAKVAEKDNGAEEGRCKDEDHPDHEDGIGLLGHENQRKQDEVG